MRTTDLKDNHNFKCFTFGQTILVKNSIHDDWQKEVFIRYDDSLYMPYVCENSKGAILGWKYAKSL
jgi:hypothetical protein